MMQGQKAAARAHTLDDAAHGPGQSPSSGTLRGSSIGDTGWGADMDAGDQIGFLDRHIMQLQAETTDEMTDAKMQKQQKFNMFMGGAILTNTVWIAIEIDFGPKEGTAFADRFGWMAVNTLFLGVFLVEILVRMHWERADWVKGMWNWFDTLVFLCGAFDVWVLTFIEAKLDSMQALSALRLARLIRLVRMVKLVKNLHGLYVIVMAFVHALQSMMFLGGIMFFGMMIYAIFATLLIGRNSAFDEVVINGDSVEDRFGMVYRSMYSLFELMTLEGWEQVARPLVETQPLTFVFIGSFILIFTYGMLNMVVATVVEKTLDQSAMMKNLSHKQDVISTMGQLVCMKKVFEHAKEPGIITLEEFQIAMASEAGEDIKKSFDNMGVPTHNAAQLFAVLDLNCDGKLNVKELFEGIQAIRAEVVSPWIQLATFAGVKTLEAQANCLPEDPGNRRLPTVAENGQAPPDHAWVMARFQAVEARLDVQDQALQEILMRIRNMGDDNPACEEARMTNMTPIRTAPRGPGLQS